MVLLKPGPPFCVHSSLLFFPIYPGGLCFEALLLPQVKMRDSVAHTGDSVRISAPFRNFPLL